MIKESDNFLVINFITRLRVRLADCFIKDNVVVEYNNYCRSIDIYVYRVEGKRVFRYDCPLNYITRNEGISELLERFTCYCVNDYKAFLADEAIRERVKEC